MSKVLHPKPWDTLRTECGRGRITYHPEWSELAPWVSFWDGTAGRHFETAQQASAYFKERFGAVLKAE